MFPLVAGRATGYNPRVSAPEAPGTIPSWLAGAATRRPVRVLLAWALLCGLAGGLAWERLGVRTDRMALIGEQHAFNRHFAQLARDFPDLDALVVVAWAPGQGDAPALRFLEAVSAGLAADRERFQGSFHRVPPEAFRGQALLFLPLPQLEAIERRLSGAAPALQHLVPGGLPAFLRHGAAQVHARLAAGPASASADDLQELGFLVRLLEGVEASLAGRAPPPAPWEDWVSAAGQRDGLVRTRQGKLILLAQPRDPADPRARERSVDALRALLERLRPLHPDVRAGLTGGPVLEVDEMRTWRRDALWATLATVLGVTILTTLSLRRLAAPLVVTLSVGAAVIVTLGLATLWPGELNLISVAFCSLLVGLGVDSGIHLVSRADEERGEGKAPEEAWAGALAGAGPPVLAGACTTALAFLATLFTEVEGIRQFGVVAGEGVVLSMLASGTLLPALLVWWGQGRPAPPPRRGRVRRLLRPLDALAARRPWALAALGLGAAALGAVYAFGPLGAAGRLRYEGNLLLLQARGLPSVALAEEVLADQAVAGMFAAVAVERLEDLERVERAVRALPAVDHTESILDVVPPAQPEKLDLLARLRAGLDPLPLGDEPRAAEPGAIAAGLSALGSALEEAAGQALGRAGSFRDAFELAERLERLAAAVAAADAAASERLRSWEAGLRQALRALLLRLREECQAARPLRPEDLPAPVRARFQGRDGSYLLRIYPRPDPWDEAGAGQFLRQVKAVVPTVSGVPIQFYEANQLLRSGYRSAAGIALGFLLFYLVLHFRGFSLPLVVLAALGAGLAWGAGLLALAGVPLNPASLIALPLTVGMGVDAAIHLVHRGREAWRHATLGGPPGVLDSGAARAALLSSATTVLCFTALGAASHHRGVASIGWACALGVSCTTLAAFLLVPALLRLLLGPRRPPALYGLPGPKTGPGGAPRRPPVQDPPPEDR